jgi:hypothetical protein
MNWSDNTLKPPFLLPEATVDNHTTSLQLTGKRVVNWGEFLNENMLHLLEHGFSKTAPNNPTIGQLWLDANTGDLKIYTSQLKWNVIKTIPGIGTQTTTPLPITSTTTTSTTPKPTTSTTTTTTSTTPRPTTTTTTTTTAAPSIGVDYPTTAIEDEEFTWNILNGANSVSYYITGASWIAGGRIPASGSLPTINGSTTTLVNGGISTYFTPYKHTITTPGTYNLTWHFSNGQTVSKSITVSAAVCVDEYTYTMEARYIKSVVRYAGSTLNKNELLVDGALQNLATQINEYYKSIVGRPGEMAGILHYYGIYESECASRGIPYTPSGAVDSTIMNDVMRPLITANYNNNGEAALGKINYVGKYCAAKSAGII